MPSDAGAGGTASGQKRPRDDEGQMVADKKFAGNVREELDDDARSDGPNHIDALSSNFNTRETEIQKIEKRAYIIYIYTHVDTYGTYIPMEFFKNKINKHPHNNLAIWISPHPETQFGHLDFPTWQFLKLVCLICL